MSTQVKPINQQRQEMYDALDKVIDTFSWCYPNGDNIRGEVTLNREENRLELVVFCQDSDDPDDDMLKPLLVTMGVTMLRSPEEQIREIIHFHVCHEADEQMWFNNERPFYPHNEDGSMRDV